MKTDDLLTFISGNVPYTYYPNSFPVTAPDDCGVVRLTGGSGPTSTLLKPSFQVLIRSAHPRTAEAKAWEVFNFLNLKTGFDVGLTHVVFCTAQQSTPLFIGEDENGRSLYSVNFNTISEVF
jgi:hypothetical protein